MMMEFESIYALAFLGEMASMMASYILIWTTFDMVGCISMLGLSAVRVVGLM